MVRGASIWGRTGSEAAEHVLEWGGGGHRSKRALDI